MNSKGFKNFNKNTSFNANNFNFSPRLNAALILGGFLAWGLFNSIYYGTYSCNAVDVGHYAIKFNKFTGLSPIRYSKGYNFKMPVIEKPIIYNVQTR